MTQVTYKHLISSILIFMCAFLLTGAALCFAAPVITDIQIEGNERIDSTSILRTMSIEVGDLYSESLVTMSVRDLFRMGAFSRVSIEDEVSDDGVTLTVSVVEFPMIRRIEFDGRKSVDEVDLKKALKLKAFSFADPARLPEEIRALEGVYSAAGYHGTTITADVQEVQNGVVITYVIKESEKSLIHEVSIIGNRNIEDNAIRKVMANREIGPLSFISGSGGYDANAAADDLQRIQYLYMEKGYLDIKAEEPDVRIHPEGRGLFVSIKVEEGPQYTLGGVRYTGDWEELPEHVRREPEVKVGGVFVRSKMMGDLRMYEDSYRDKGYAWCRIEPLFEKDPEKEEVVLNLVLEKGPQVHVRWIHISGNSKTRDYVIRREMHLLEGELFDQKKLDDSLRFIKRLGFFSAVAESTAAR